MKSFTVNYSVTVHYDAVVRAKTKEEAEKKIAEVVGDSVTIESSWEVK
jgi:hypothetical protein